MNQKDKKIFSSDFYINQNKKIIIGAPIFLLVILIPLVMEFFTPVLELQQMQKVQGTILGAQDRGRSSCGDTITLETPEGQTIKFRAWLSRNESDYIKNNSRHAITVWAQNELTFCGTVPFIHQIMDGSFLVEDYEQSKLYAKKLHNAIPKIIITAFILVISIAIFGINSNNKMIEISSKKLNQNSKENV